MARPKRICSIPDCGKPVHGQCFCVAHYQRWRKHGTPRGGRATMNGEPERYFREVVLAYEGDECLTWPFGCYKSGYGKLGNGTVHRRVCEEAHGPAPTSKHEAAHSCGRGHLACVTKRHLDWKTPAGNQADRVTHGTSNRGERQWAAKLTEADAREAKALKGKMSQGRIAAKLGVNRKTISDIHLDKTWAWLE